MTVLLPYPWPGQGEGSSLSDVMAGPAKRFASVKSRFSEISPPAQGAIFVTLAAFFFALMNTGARIVADHGFHPTEIAFFRNIIALFFMLPWLLRTRFVGGRTKRLGAHFKRAAVGLCGMMLWFASISVLPMGQAVALNFTFPLFATILAALVLKEDVRARRWSATGIGFLGVLVILQPWDAEVQWISLLPVAAALFMACTSVLVKSLAGTESPATMVFYTNLFMAPLSLVPAVFFWTWPNLEELGIFLAMGFFATISHLCLTQAYVVADSSAIQPFDYLRLPFTALFAFLLFNEVPDGWLWVGAGIIAGSTFYIVRREAQVAREQRRQTARVASAPKDLP